MMAPTSAIMAVLYEFVDISSYVSGIFPTPRKYT